MADEARYCDLVMKGGITSGLVYPRAVVELARKYRFKNIGGTSAGAIAAAAAAAAALGERRRFAAPGRFSEAGMEGLSAVAEELAERGFIYSLFQPCPSGRATFDLLLGLVSGTTVMAKAMAGVLAVLRLGWGAALTTLVMFCLLGKGVGGAWGAVAALFPALFCAAGAGVLQAGRKSASAVSGNLMGLCSGLKQGEYSGQGLTEWLHAVTRTLAGASRQTDRPIVFRDLWKAPRYPEEPQTPRAVELQMITTNLSHSEPRTLPFTNRGFYFLEEEFERLFPPAIVRWLKTHALSTWQAGDKIYHELPAPDDLPIVVAARMSLSFPLLISAVPLYEREFSAENSSQVAPSGVPRAARREKANLAQATDELAIPAQVPLRDVPMRRCWFSDGGISSNFPIHLFDAPLPRWPTFAIDLVYAAKGQEAPPLFLPENNGQGLWPRYVAIGGKGPVPDLVAFVGAIVATMQNWRDLLQGRAPGHRDRIARVGLTPEEGGMNLDMESKTLRALAEKGAEAGKLIVREFRFDNHFWVRYRNAMSGVERYTISFAKGLEPPLTSDNKKAFDRMWSDRASQGPYAFSRVQAQEAVSRVRDMKNAAEIWSDAGEDLTRGAPKPLPVLRLTPTY